MGAHKIESPERTSETAPAVKQFEFKLLDISQLPIGVLRKRGFDLILKHIESISIASRENGVITYCIEIKARNEQFPAKEIFFVDYVAGYEVGYVKIQHTNKMSFVENTNTADEFQKKGLGTERFIMANHYTISHYHQSLHSGYQTLKQGRRLWKSLIRKGLAEPTGESTSHIYRFKTSSADSK